jgi:hypothetical protein
LNPQSIRNQSAIRNPQSAIRIVTMQCPGCAAAMTALTLDGHLGTTVRARPLLRLPGHLVRPP